jgi:putative ABC transport system permease protein
MTFIDALSQDTRFAVRTLRRSPGYVTAAILILGLGIGANTAIFSVVDGVLLKPLPFRAGHELTLIQQTAPVSRVADASVSIPELADYRARLHSVRDLVEYHGMAFTLLDQGEPSRVDTGVVSANFFDMLGIKPLKGRAFVAEDDEHGAEAVLMLSYRYWQKKFGGDEHVIGKVVEMNNRAHTIVGVLPDFPQYPRENDVYMPTSACPFRDAAGRTLPQGHRTFGLRVFGRLAPGATAETAAAEVASIASSFPRDYPQDYQRAQGLTGRTVSLEETLVRDARPMLLALAGTTILVLIIACANIANLALGRTMRRSRELAVRTALGAGRGRLLRQLLTESLIVALAGGVVGLGLAWWSLHLLVTFVGRFTPRTGQIAIDASVLAFTFGASLLTGLIFGVVPALAARRNPVQSIRDGSAQVGEGRLRRRLRSGLVVAQVAVSFVLLVGATLLLESFHRLSTVDLGYRTDKVITAAIFGNFTTMNSSADAALRIHTGILERLRSTPGVVAAAVTSSVPLSNIQPGQSTIRIEGRTSSDRRVLEADPNVASDGYFETLAIPVVAGRTLRPSDTQDAPPVAVINESMARYWDASDPIGSRFIVEGARRELWITVVGVVKDFRLYRADREVEPQFYRPFQQTGGFAGRVLVRADGNPRALASAIQAAVHAVDPKAPVEELQTLDELKEGRLAAPGLTAGLLSIFAVVALVITLAGVAGVISTSVAHRTREFGLRMALGASRRSVLQLVLGQGVLLVGIGLVIGLAGAYAFSQLITTYLFATRVTDVAAYAGVALVFLAAAIVAAAGPARRATTIDPLIALKTE